MNYSDKEAIIALRSALHAVRTSTPHGVFSHTCAASSDIRTGYLEGNPVVRLVVTLRAPGCSWVKRSGGCTMCGHFAGTTGGIIPTADEYLTQFQSEIARYDIENIKIISIYNSGSMLNPDEIGFDALKRIFVHVRTLPPVVKVVLESRAEYINSALLEELLDILGPSRKLSVAIGLETADDSRRSLCINKGCSLEEIRSAVRSAQGIAEIQLYVLLGLPFLTESEVLEDAVSSLFYARDMGADEIHIEPATIQRYTLTELLFNEGLFKLPSLYTIYEVLGKVVPEIRPYVSPFTHMPGPDVIPQGCPLCTERLFKGLLERYNIYRTRESLEYEYCECMHDWRKSLNKTDSRPLTLRVQETLSRIENCLNVEL